MFQNIHECSGGEAWYASLEHYVGRVCSECTAIVVGCVVSCVYRGRGHVSIHDIGLYANPQVYMG